MQKLLYKTANEAIEAHEKSYRSDGWIKGKYGPHAPDSFRVAKLLSEIPEGSVVLDVGCNSGGLGVLLQKKGCVVYGLDVVKELVEKAMLKGTLAKLGRCEEIPFPDSKFDAVVLAEVLEHLYEPEDGIIEITRVLKPDGVFVGSVPHADGIMGRKKADYHQSVFGRGDLEKLLRTYYDEVEITNTPYNRAYATFYNIDPEQPQWMSWTCRKISS